MRTLTALTQPFGRDPRPSPCAHLVMTLPCAQMGVGPPANRSCSVCVTSADVCARRHGLAATAPPPSPPRHRPHHPTTITTPHHHYTTTTPPPQHHQLLPRDYTTITTPPPPLHHHHHYTTTTLLPRDASRRLMTRGRGRRQARCHAPNRARDAAPSGLRLQGTDLAMKSPRARRADRPPPSTTATRMVPRARHATRGLDVRVEAAPDLVGAAAVAMSRRSCDAPPPPPLPSAAARCMPAALGTCRSATGAQARRAFRAGAVRRARV
jgi:hypothetical protein